MKLFNCQHCGQIVFFANTHCERCKYRLGYLPEASVLSALEPDGDLWRPLAAPERPLRFCANAASDVCNWLIAADDSHPFCLACRHNRIVPNLADPQQLDAWRELEGAKHRLFYTLIRLKLPLGLGIDQPGEALIFDFLADPPAGPKVLTGHDDGVITIAIAEADDAEREARRKAMGEVYRTLLGHFRHEVGHYIWDVLVRDTDALERFRALFGDERPDYATALQAHYRNGAPAGWQNAFVTPYATSHPWEDFAETFAHYLHIVDTLETAASFGLRVRPKVEVPGDMNATIDFDPYEAGPFQRLIDCFLPVRLAMNGINEAMGRPDLYPFVLSPPAIEKLRYMHELLRHCDGNAATGALVEAAA